MIKRFIIFLIRRRLGLKNKERFRFLNQKSKEDYYFFYKDMLIKYESEKYWYRPASVSLNWLIDDNCKIKKLA